MLIVGIIFSIGLLGVIIYFAISAKSSRLLKLTAIIALGLISLSLVISGIFIIKGPAEDPSIIQLPVFQDTAPQVKKSFRVVDIVILAVMIIGLVVVIVKASKDQKKTPKKAASKSRGALDFPDDDAGHSGKDLALDEESFELDDLDLK